MVYLQRYRRTVINLLRVLQLRKASDIKVGYLKGISNILIKFTVNLEGLANAILARESAVRLIHRLQLMLHQHQGLHKRL